jgi:hypothetical protein
MPAMAKHHAPTEAADHDADAYIHGTMSIEEQVATWALVQNILKWGSLAVAALLLFLTIWFQPGGSFIGGLLAGLVVAVAGWFFLKGGKASSH